MAYFSGISSKTWPDKDQRLHRPPLLACCPSASCPILAPSGQQVRWLICWQLVVEHRSQLEILCRQEQEQVGRPLASPGRGPAGAHNDNTSWPGRAGTGQEGCPSPGTSCHCFGYPFIDAANFRNDFENKNRTTNGKKTGRSGKGLRPIVCIRSRNKTKAASWKRSRNYLPTIDNNELS